MRIHEGKVRAVHGGDASDYAILPMPEIFETASMYLKENFNHVRFESSSFSHSLVTVSWEVRDDSLLDTYRDLLLQYGYAAGSEISAYIRVHSSDVAASGANIFCTIREGTRELVLGSALKLEHTNGAVIAGFCKKHGADFFPIPGKCGRAGKTIPDRCGASCQCHGRTYEESRDWEKR